jgi:hypothetical protein
MAGTSTTHVAPQFQPVFRELGIDAEAVFDDPQIKPWRTLPDRENCLLEATLHDGSAIRWHVKRYPAGNATMDDEVRGHRALLDAGIPTAVLVAWGRSEDGRSFVIFEDLAGFHASDKLLQQGQPLSRLLEPTASLAAKLHNAGLHHRDLYLCHFFTTITGDPPQVRLIDTARVKPLPGVLTRTRWIVKDLAQFWYSTLEHDITDAQRDAWLDRYAQLRKIGSVDRLKRKIARKVAWIERHDRRLRQQQPHRNISIPGGGVPQPPTS